MTTVAFFTTPEIGLIGFRASGHTGYADRGADIVCAAVSALTEATLNGLLNVVKAPVRYERDEERALLAAYLDPECAAEVRKQAQILLLTLREAAEAIARAYPDNVRIIFKERRK
jgi:uncharacterized protein YsxB (DUF464 family)